jgi:hypothetical protein
MPGRLARVLDVAVFCPHCKVGQIPVLIEPHDEKPLGEQVVGGLHTPRQCPACKGYSTLKLKIDVSAAPYELPKKAPTQGALLRAITNT